MPKVSIITINLNNLQGLIKTVQSVKNQVFTDFEYIVIDGGSTDGSYDYIASESALFSYSVSEADSGVYNAMNKGIQKATGEYCLFLNSGDYLYNSTTLQQIFEHKPTEDILYGDSINGDIYSKYPEIVTPLYLFRKPLLHQASFIKRSLFEQFGMYNESYKIVSDWEFFLKTLYQAKVSYKYIPNIPIVCFDMGGINNTQQELVAHEKEQLLRSVYAEQYEEYNTYNSMWTELQQAQQTIKKIGYIQNSWEYKIGRLLLTPIRWIQNLYKNNIS